MSKINLLDSSIYNLIAAGEVVEKPASVIKELVENSIDAKSKNITIEIKNGGITFMQVSDDGCGIEEDDIKSAFLPHATSKIKSAEDLDSIFTLGFRGEALASIASVAKVSICTKTLESDVATSLTVEGGKFGEIGKESRTVGTTITVKDLFFCVPARAKFLKKPKTEEQEITNIITRIILAHPEINIVYIVDGKKVLSSMGNTLKDAMFSVYGKESVNETLSIFTERENVKVEGFVGKPTYSKSNRTYQTLIINGRYVVNLTVQTAVSNAYGDFLMKRQYPFFVLNLTLPFDEIDVNVHPNKLDVKFLKSNLIYSVIFDAVSKALFNMDYVKDIELSDFNKNNDLDGKSLLFNNKIQSNKIDKAGVNLNPFSGNFENLNKTEKENLENVVLDSMFETSSNSSDSVRDNFGLGSKLLERINQKLENGDETAFESDDYVNSKKVRESNSATNIESENKMFSNSNIKVMQEDFASDEIKIIGKIFNTYIVIEWGQNIYYIDQHAAHERLKYDKLKAEYESGNIIVQPLLVPYVYSANTFDSEVIDANLEALNSVGFDVCEFGDKTYKISAVPVIVSDIDFNKFFSMFLADKLNKTKITQAELIKDDLMQMACKSAIKGGDDLTKDEINKLLKEFCEKNAVLFCPHGRPVVVKISKFEIEKWFKRIV